MMRFMSPLSATPNGRRVLFGALYFSEGAPIGFIWWALPTVLAARGESIEKITTVQAFLAWPWALKFLWAPLVDALRSPRWGHRAWIISAQFVMGAAMVPLIWLDVQADLGVVMALILVHAFAATTQDVAIDAWAINLTEPTEHGRLNAAMTMGKYFGRWLFGAGLLIVWHHLGAPLVIGALIASIWATAVLVWFSEDVAQPTAALGVRTREFGRTMRHALTLRNTWLGFVIALISGAGFEAVGAVARPMMIGLGYDPAAVGWWSTGWFGVMFIGAWLGGVTSDRWGHRRCVAAYLVLVAAMIGAFSAVLVGSPQPATVAVMIGVVYFGIGLFVTTSYALFMDLTDERISGTQFSAFMGAANGCEVWSGRAAGALAKSVGYPLSLMLMMLVSLAALPVLALIRPSSEQRAEESRGGD